MTNKQLELGLAGSNQCPRTVQRQRQANRATWWFHQMHQLVDQAVEWEPAPRFQMEEQIWLTVTPKQNSKQN
ncbi:MAG: hypothetical protein JWQ71_107 [Pedosphaera sp.]|nr:hypothetical protein [Pedosphaera sp.]